MLKKTSQVLTLKTVSSHFHMLVRPMLLHRMALVSVRLFCKNLGNLQEFFWANGLPPPVEKNCPYAYVCNSHIPSCFWRVSEALRHWGLPVTFFFVFELLFLCSVLFRGSLLSLFYVTREFNTEDELDIACVCGTLQFYNLQVVAWFWSFMFWFSSSADYLRLDHTGRQYTDVIKLYHIFIILYSPLILV